MMDLLDYKKDVQAEEGRKMQNGSHLHGIFPFVGCFLSGQTSLVGLGAYCLFSSPQQEAKHVLAGMI